MAYRFKTRPTVQGAYRLVSGTLGALLSAGSILLNVNRGDGVVGTFAAIEVIDAAYVLAPYKNYTGGDTGTLTLPAVEKVDLTNGPFGASGTGSTPTLDMAIWMLIPAVPGSATLPTGVQEFKRDEWTRAFETGEAAGVTFRHTYSIPWAASLSTLGFVEGQAMPSRPSSGIGSTAVITVVTLGVKHGTSRQVVEITGFEAKEWT